MRTAEKTYKYTVEILAKSGFVAILVLISEEKNPTDEIAKPNNKHPPHIAKFAVIIPKIDPHGNISLDVSTVVLLS